MSLAFSTKLIDWRASDGEPVAENPIDSFLAVYDKRIDITFEDNRSIWIEREGDRITVHAYDSAHDEPINLRIHKNSIEVDRHDYDAAEEN